MRLRIHHALFAGFLGVIGLLVFLILVLVGEGLRGELRSTFEEDLQRHLNLGEAILSSAAVAAPDSLARVITDAIGYRVTIMSMDGTVLGDSYVDPERVGEIENHAGRPEVRAVVEGADRTAFAERTSSTVGVSLLYGARRASVAGVPVVLRIAAPQTAIETAVGRVQRTVTLTGLAAMLVAMIAAWLISVAFARPLVELADRTRRLSSGDFSSTVPRARVVELQEVAVAFNRLADQLEARLSELEHERDEMQTLIDCMAEGVVALTDDARLLRTNRTARALLGLPDAPQVASIASVVRDPELRRVLEESVARPAQSREITIGGRNILLASRALDLGGSVTTLLDISELRRLERVRRDFVANASHELKTPLTSIRGYAEMLVDDDAPAEIRRKFLTAIRDNTLRLQRLVDDLLDLSRLESGGWTAAAERVDVVDVVDEAWELLAPGARGAIELSVEGDGAIVGDRQGLVQVFRNLFENSVRHTSDDGHVHVSLAKRDAHTLEIAVSDDGEGIPAKVLPRIFERFYRADSSRARDFGGTGLGLAIVKHLVGAMGGEVRAESVLGQGTTIRITLPST